MQSRVIAEECAMVEPMPRACWYAIWAALESTMKLQRWGREGEDEERIDKRNSARE
jgi:hypothetical protein